MPKKLTVLGALAAIVLGAVSLLGDGGTAMAGPGGPIQNFDVNATVCYGGAQPSAPPITCGAGSSDTIAQAGTQYNVIQLQAGSRLTLPVTYTPTDFPTAASLDGASVGTVTAQTDVFCNAAYRDVLAAPPHTGNTVLWPASWTGYDFLHEDPPFVGAADVAAEAASGIEWPTDDSFLMTIKPTPGDATGIISHDKAILTDLKLEGGGTINLYNNTGSTSPLSLLTEASTYNPGLRTSVAILAGAPSPPGGFLCLDSPQNSVAESTVTGIPAVDGLYPRFTVFTSAADLRAGTVSRLIDLQCVRVGAAVTDTDGDCIGDTTDPAPLVADADGDALVDGIEAELGTSRTVADSDGDGADDFTELANFTRPILGGSVACPAPFATIGPNATVGGVAVPNNTAIDTDCDGQMDRPENGGDEVAAFPNNIADTSVDDNCPNDFNPNQENSDSPPYNVTPAPGSTPYDHTDPSSDDAGDACDTDDDNDGISDVAEAGLAIEPAPVVGDSFCEQSTGGGDPQNDPTDPLNADTDQDYAMDGIECRYLRNPQSALSRIPDEAVDNLSAEDFWRTEKINVTTGGVENDDFDGPGGAGDGQTGTADSDSDDDALIDGTEVKYYGTDPSNDDTDSDGCTDGEEAGDINSNRQINVADLQQIAAVQGTHRDGLGQVDLTKMNRDIVKSANAQINVADIQRAAAVQGNCPIQQGTTIVQENDGQTP